MTCVTAFENAAVVGGVNSARIARVNGKRCDGTVKRNGNGRSAHNDDSRHRKETQTMIIGVVVRPGDVYNTFDNDAERFLRRDYRQGWKLV